jgi:hypothetical protein
MEVYHQASFVTIGWDEDTGCVVSELKGYAAGQEYRNAVEKGLELLIQKKSDKWLGDMRKGTVMSQEDAQWAQQDWRPRAAEAGLKWTALVLSESALQQMQLDRMHRVEKSLIETAYFTDVDEAKAWLQSVG